MESRIILAIDGCKRREAIKLVEQTGSRLLAVKMHDMIDIYGPGIIKDIKSAGAGNVMADFKLYDTSKTVRNRAAALRDAGADILTIHASGGIQMMQAAMEGFEGGEVWAVTALTSLSKMDASDVYRSSTVLALVKRLARLAKQAGVPGIVCSANEVKILSKRKEFKDFKFAVPGIRLPGQSHGDHKRYNTPLNTLQAGATYLIIGEAITSAANRTAALNQIEAEIAKIAA